MRIFLIVALLMVMVSSLVLSGCAAPAPSTKPAPTPAPAPTPTSVIGLKYGHHDSTTARTTIKYHNLWSKNVEDATKGMVKITQYPAESLFKMLEGIEATVGGTTDICWTVPGSFGQRFALTLVMALPFLSLSSGKIDGKIRSSGFVNSHIMQELYDTLPELQAEWKEVKVLMLTCTQTNNLFTTKKPVRNMNDVKGLKIREAGGYNVEMWKMLGGSPVALPMPEVYESLSKGVLDGMNTSWTGLSASKAYEVLKYWTDASTTATPIALFMNIDKWNKLPPDIQKAIMSVSGMAGAEVVGDATWGFDTKDDIVAAAEKSGKSLERVELDAGEYDKWKEIAGKPLWDKWVVEMKAKGLNAQKVLDAALNLVKKYSP